MLSQSGVGQRQMEDDDMSVAWQKQQEQVEVGYGRVWSHRIYDYGFDATQYGVECGV